MRTVFPEYTEGFPEITIPVTSIFTDRASFAVRFRIIKAWVFLNFSIPRSSPASGRGDPAIELTLEELESLLFIVFEDEWELLDFDILDEDCDEPELRDVVELFDGDAVAELGSSKCTDFAVTS
ncbi:unnamed protein product [Strongylus vulgaris]|uniref:Uncharacterized protein n=1 Tax=Strongylus vulgaris TaxID=40348 RepID=A0A3P7KDN5_STRVU|nr:unnamed protein product [Strongylus vulgaris]